MSKSLTPRTVRQQSAKLTARETEVLQLICLGYTTKEIAGRLGISFKTASCHRTRLLQKAGVTSSIRLFRWALFSGFVSLSDREDLSNACRPASDGAPRPDVLHGVHTTIYRGPSHPA